jgi:hypothetical protein
VYRKQRIEIEEQFNQANRAWDDKDYKGYTYFKFALISRIRCLECILRRLKSCEWGSLAGIACNRCIIEGIECVLVTCNARMSGFGVKLLPAPELVETSENEEVTSLQ